MNQHYHLLCISRIDLNFEDLAHKSVLVEIYNGLMEQYPPSLTGDHWIQIGFLGDDPRTETRGFGLFDLLMTLYFIEKSADLCKKMFELSQVKARQFPFCNDNYAFDSPL